MELEYYFTSHATSKRIIRNKNLDFLIFFLDISKNIYTTSRMNDIIVTLGLKMYCSNSKKNMDSEFEKMDYLEYDTLFFRFT